MKKRWARDFSERGVGKEGVSIYLPLNYTVSDKSSTSEIKQHRFQIFDLSSGVLTKNNISEKNNKFKIKNIIIISTYSTGDKTIQFFKNV